MGDIKTNLYVFVKGIKYFFRSYKIAKKGQDPKYELLQTCHRIEKGLLIDNPKPGWGWEKIYRIQSLIAEMDNCFEKKVGQSTINKYIDEKKKSSNPIDTANLTMFKCTQDSEAGVKVLDAEDIKVKQVEVAKSLFTTRHSIRDFERQMVPHSIIDEAVTLANHCPSACNRQVAKVYVISGEKRRELYSGDVQGICPPQFLIVTGNIRAFAIDELYDWLVSSSIFIGYLTLALHTLGVGSCCLRKALFVESESVKSLRNYCHIPDDEQVVLELAIGFYKEKNKVPVSARKESEELVIYYDNNNE